MFGLGTTEVLLLATLALLMIFGLFVVWRMGVFGPRKLANEEGKVKS